MYLTTFHPEIFEVTDNEMCCIFHRVDAEVFANRRGESAHPHAGVRIQHRGKYKAGHQDSVWCCAICNRR